MKVLRKALLSGAREAEGITIVIDVYRAFTTAAVLVAKGVDRLLLVPTPQRALELKEELGALAVGEVGGVMPEGFDFGNSPSVIARAGRSLFEGKTVVHRSSAGVQGALAAMERSQEVLLSSFVTVGATARYARARAVEAGLPVCLVPMGGAGLKPTLEDEVCADCLEALLTGNPHDDFAALARVVADEETAKFLRGDRVCFPREDPLYCLQRDLFAFTLAARRTNGHVAVFAVGA